MWDESGYPKKQTWGFPRGRIFSWQKCGRKVAAKGGNIKHFQEQHPSMQIKVCVLFTTLIPNNAPPQKKKTHADI